MEDLSLEEIKQQLEEYSSQLHDVKQALQEDPQNTSLEEVATNLEEVIKVTSDLLVLKQEAELITKKGVVPEHTAEKTTTEQSEKKEEGKKGDIQEVAASKGLAVGTRCQAIYSVDGNWYDAKIETITDEGFTVTFVGYGNTDLITNPDFIKTKEQKQLKKRKREEFDTASAAVLQNIPKSLQILPTDSEKVRKIKKRRIKAIKAKVKLQKVEQDRNDRKKNWQSFLNNFGKKKEYWVLHWYCEKAKHIP